MRPRPTPREPAPGSADVATPASFVLASSGFAKEAVMQTENAMTLSPNTPPDYLGPLGIALRRSVRRNTARPPAGLPMSRTSDE